MARSGNMARANKSLLPAWLSKRRGWPLLTGIGAGAAVLVPGNRSSHYGKSKNISNGKSENPGRAWSVSTPTYTLFSTSATHRPRYCFFLSFSDEPHRFPGFLLPLTPVYILSFPLFSFLFGTFSSLSPLFLTSQSPFSIRSYSNIHGVRRWGDDDDANMTCSLFRPSATDKRKSGTRHGTNHQ